MAVERAVKRIRPADYELSQVQDNLANTVDGLLVSVDRASFRRTIALGEYWTNGTMPTSDAPMERAIVRGSTAATMGAREMMTVAGCVRSLQGVANGLVSGIWTLTLYINDKPAALTCSTMDIKMLATKARGALNFAAGDVLSVYIRGSNSSIQQAFSASVDVEGQA